MQTTSSPCLASAAQAYVRTFTDEASRGRFHSAATFDARAAMVAAARAELARLDPVLGQRSGVAFPALVRVLLAAVSPMVAETASADTIAFDAAWVDSGRPTFVLSSSLLAQLILTDPGRVAEQDIAWPFEAFRVVLPALSGIQFLDGEGRLVEARSMDVVRWRGLRSDQGLALGRYRGAREFVAEALRVIKRAEGLASYSGACVRVNGSNGMSLFHNQLWDDSGTVADWMTESTSLDESGGAAMHADYSLTDVDRRALSVSQRVVVSLALYLTSTSEETGKPTWSPSAKPVGRSGRWEIGRDVRIGREIRDAAAAVAGGRSASAPSVKHVVRGHFRNQAVGVGRSERKRIYIAPHWRGPGEEAKSRVYRVR